MQPHGLHVHQPVLGPWQEQQQQEQQVKQTLGEQWQRQGQLSCYQYTADLWAIAVRCTLRGQESQVPLHVRHTPGDGWVVGR
jgi:hypothetical protein